MFAKFAFAQVQEIFKFKDLIFQVEYSLPIFGGQQGAVVAQSIIYLEFPEDGGISHVKHLTNSMSNEGGTRVLTC